MLWAWVRNGPHPGHPLKLQLYNHDVFIHHHVRDGNDESHMAAFRFFFKPDVLHLRGPSWQCNATVTTDGMSASLLYEVCVLGGQGRKARERQGSVQVLETGFLQAARRAACPSLSPLLTPGARCHCCLPLVHRRSSRGLGPLELPRQRHRRRQGRRQARLWLRKGARNQRRRCGDATCRYAWLCVFAERLWVCAGA